MTNSLYDNEIFDKDLENIFSNETFYANPMTTKIYFSFKEKKDGESSDDLNEQIIGNAVVANLEEVNEKIPVYSYNSSTYQKYLQGKRIITGVIALRKVTIASFLNLIKRKKEEDEINKDIENIEKQINELKKIRGENNTLPNALIFRLKNQIAEFEKERDVIIKKDEFYIDESARILEKDNLLYYIENANADKQTGGNTAKFRIEFQNSFGKNPVTQIKDVLFIKKQTEINIDKTDIFEVYSFIGNPSLDFIDDKTESKSVADININDAKKLSDYEII